MNGWIVHTLLCFSCLILLFVVSIWFHNLGLGVHEEFGRNLELLLLLALLLLGVLVHFERSKDRHLLPLTLSGNLFRGGLEQMQGLAILF